MPIIDNKGFIHILKWKINIIDFSIILFFICSMFMVCFGSRIFKKMVVYEEKTVIPTTYKINRICPNCKNNTQLKIPYGEPIKKDFYEVICNYCRNEVEVRGIIPKVEPSTSINYQQLYYKWLLKYKLFNGK